jgi:hypothetical protein
MSFITQLFHKHNWTLIQEVTTKSLGELQGECIGHVNSPRNSIQLREIYGRKHITTFTCDCGKIKRFVEEV